jgi:chromosome segregation ATPase
MLKRDDEDLAIEQLPAVGRADEPELARSPIPETEPPQERAAALAEPTTPVAATRAQLRELRERIEHLEAQLRALPTRQVARIEHLEERALRLSTQREALAGQLARLPEPRRRFGRERDDHPIERAQVSSALGAHDRELQRVMTRWTGLVQKLSDPAEIRAERDGLERAISETARELRAVRDEIVERKLRPVSPDRDKSVDKRFEELARGERQIGLGVEQSPHS